MGLLDDAIREHLELKRLRGADPGDVARDEQAALGPAHRQGERDSDDLQPGDAGATRSDESSPPEAEPAKPGDAPAGQETVEINMEAELAVSDSEPSSTPDNAEQRAAVAHPANEQASSGESLEWEMPGDRPNESDLGLVEAPPEADELERSSDEPVEDVLEETPDFLRDTPEQERLWFEQRPPRDFDFNE